MTEPKSNYPSAEDHSYINMRIGLKLIQSFDDLAASLKTTRQNLLNTVLAKSVNQGLPCKLNSEHLVNAHAEKTPLRVWIHKKTIAEVRAEAEKAGITFTLWTTLAMISVLKK